MSEALKFLASSKTLLMWLAIFIIAFIAIVFGTLMAAVFGLQVPYISEFFDLLTVGGGGATARNVLSDGIAPRIPQAMGAVRDPGVALQAPVSMRHAEPNGHHVAPEPGPPTVRMPWE